MGAPQLDLFGDVTPAALPPPPVIAPFFPRPPTVEWQRRLVACEHARKVTVLVSWIWTGVVVETLADGARGRWFLHSDGFIQDVTPDPGAVGRCVFLNPHQAQDIHARHPMIMTGPDGSHCALYRFAGAGEAAPAELPLPPAVENCEL
jgi:hypothetical protein